jgi:hypothetical protein
VGKKENVSAQKVGILPSFYIIACGINRIGINRREATGNAREALRDPSFNKGGRSKLSDGQFSSDLDYENLHDGLIKTRAGTKAATR